MSAMTTNDDATAWQGGSLDLDAYLRRTGYDGELVPTLDVLRALTRAHITSIPFETVEIVLGRPISSNYRTSRTSWSTVAAAATATSTPCCSRRCWNASASG